mmetsp:Transcript_4169/g.10419  ORF Transcript_4169/g.10419 Transcript_4169/m.10419 type:complete len:254 (+) Transcript_4169:1063-1824(+)
MVRPSRPSTRRLSATAPRSCRSTWSQWLRPARSSAPRCCLSLSCSRRRGASRRSRRSRPSACRTSRQQQRPPSRQARARQRARPRRPGQTARQQSARRRVGSPRRAASTHLPSLSASTQTPRPLCPHSPLLPPLLRQPCQHRRPLRRCLPPCPCPWLFQLARAWCQEPCQHRRLHPSQQGPWVLSQLCRTQLLLRTRCGRVCRANQACTTLGQAATRRASMLCSCTLRPCTRLPTRQACQAWTGSTTPVTSPT